MSVFGDPPMLTVGYAEARPWAYRIGPALRGLDIRAAEDVALLLQRPVTFVPCLHADLRRGLLARRFDIAIGGLVRPGIDLVALPVRHFLRSVDPAPGDRRLQDAWQDVLQEEQRTPGSSVRLERIHFPNVWWVRRGRPTFLAQLRLALYWRHLRLALLRREVLIA